MNVVLPNTDVVVAGLITPTALDATGMTLVPVEFEMRDGSTAIGVHIDGYAQESILSWEGYDPVNAVWFPVNYTPMWFPPDGVTSTLFYLAANRIIDRKSTYCDPGWYAMFALNFTWMKVMQMNQLVAKNWTSEEVKIQFPSHNFTMQKSGASTWILVE